MMLGSVIPVPILDLTLAVLTTKGKPKSLDASLFEKSNIR